MSIGLWTRSRGMKAAAEVLLVEDDAVLARHFAAALRRAGTRVATAGTLAEAAQRLREGAPGAVVLDLGLPDGDGAALLPSLAALALPPPVIVVSGDASNERRVALWRGVAMVLSKPLHSDALVAAVAAVMAPRQRLLAPLSPRERAVVEAAVAGLDSDQTARELGCTAATVATYWQRVFAKLGLRSCRAVLAAIAREALGSRGAGHPSSGRDQSSL